MGRDPTVLAATTRALLDRAASERLDRTWLIARAQISPATLEAPDGRVSRGAHLALWSAVAGALARPDLGAHFAESVRAQTFGTLGFLAMASANVQEALECSVTHHRLVKDSVSTRLVAVDDGQLLEEVGAPGQPPWPAPVAEYALASYLVLLRQWTERPIHPRIVFFPHAPPPHVEPVARAFGCEVRFGQPLLGFVLDPETLRLPLQTAQPDLKALLASIAQQADAHLPRDWASILLQDVRRAVADRLGGKDVQLGRVAHDLRTSPRTLQRRLGELGTSFHAVVEDVRRRAALPLVTGSRLSIEAIGERLGYAETAAFRRAFKRWTGVAPSATRRTLRRDAGDGAEHSGAK